MFNKFSSYLYFFKNNFSKEKIYIQLEKEKEGFIKHQDMVGNFILLNLFYAFVYTNYEYTIKSFFYNIENFYLKILYDFNLPIFFYFGLFFILTNIFSLLFMSYLGLYGVFIINLISLFFFEFLLLYILRFFS